MSNAVIRNAQLTELPHLKAIWRSVFGYGGEDAFYRIFFNPDLCVVADYDSAPVSMGYLVPFGDIQCGKDSIPCAMIFAVATLPKYRGLGLGRLIVNELVRLAHELGYQAIVLCPSEDSLFEYYEAHSEMTDWFYAYEHTFHKLSNINMITDSPPLTELTIGEYSVSREGLLKDITHIKHGPRIFEYQVALNEEHGGGFYKIGNACATIELQSDGTVWVKELLIPQLLTNSSESEKLAFVLESNNEVTNILATIAYTFPASEHVIRAPVRSGEGRRFGMLTMVDSMNGNIESGEYAPWYGLAFD